MYFSKTEGGVNRVHDCVSQSNTTDVAICANAPRAQHMIVWHLIIRAAVMNNNKSTFSKEFSWNVRRGPIRYLTFWASLVAQLLKNLPAMWETWVRSLGWEDPLEKGKATHSSILAWRIPWTLKSRGSQRVGHN